MTGFGTSLSNSDGVSQSLFRALDLSRRNHLSFHEFLLGLSAMDKNTTHGRDAGELRCGYIFRYYINSCNQSESSAAFLGLEDMKNLTKDVLKLKSLQVEESKWRQSSNSFTRT